MMAPRISESSVDGNPDGLMRGKKKSKFKNESLASNNNTTFNNLAAPININHNNLSAANVLGDTKLLKAMSDQ